MLNKKVTRKQFLLSALSIGGAVFMASKLKLPSSSSVKNIFSKKEEDSNIYGNYSYGGGKKNA
jgi:hypothetical protein